MTARRMQGAGGAQATTQRRQARLGSNQASVALKPFFDAMSERELQAIVEDGLRSRGYIVWHVRDSRLMAAGLPDIIAVSPHRPDRRVLFYELKSEHGRIRPMQRLVMTALDGIEGIDARIIRPSEWDAVLATLPGPAGTIAEGES